MSKIINYLPRCLQDILEFQLINNDLDTELNLLDRNIKAINTETIVKTATEYGINRWEKCLGITPGDGDSLETRKFRITNILTDKLPYTYRWLKNKLTEITGSSTAWILNINYEEYTIAIILAGLNTSWMAEVQKQLRVAIPANMKLEIGGEPLSGSSLKYGIGTHIAYKLEFRS